MSNFSVVQMLLRRWHILIAILLNSPSLVQAACKTMAELRISQGTQAASCFSEADANNDAEICEDEVSALTDCIESIIAYTPSNVQPGTTAVVLYSNADCLGDTVEVPNNAEEELCDGCFDACGRQYSEGAATPASILNVRSILVKTGTVRITYSACYGREVFDEIDSDFANVSGPGDRCFNIKSNVQPKHFELRADGPSQRGAKQFMAFYDSDQDGFVSRLEAKEMENLHVFPAIDVSGDGKISEAEIVFWISKFEKKPNDMSGFGRAAYEDMARASLSDAEGNPPSKAEIEAEATRRYGKQYNRAKLVSSHKFQKKADTSSTENDPLVASGQIFGGGQAEGSVHMCADGRLSTLDLCYKPCNWEMPNGFLDRCWASCPSGTTDIGLYCAKSVFDWDDKPNYYRGVGTPIKICELGGSFGPGKFTGTPKTHFTFGIIADPQIPWCSEGEKGNKDCAIKENQEVIKALDSAAGKLEWAKGDPLRGLSGVFLNGDLTAYGHAWQFNVFRALFESNSAAQSENNLKLPIWLNLGNHDYANNLNDCWFGAQELYWLGYGSNSCAQRMLAYVRSAVTGCGDNTIVPAFGGRVDHYDQGSAAYTVSFGKLRAVMLHNYPTYDAYGKIDQYNTPMEFLRKEIEYANSTKDYLMLFYHDNGDHFKIDHENTPEFVKLVQGSRVVATFHGHIHGSGGNYINGLRAKKGASSIYLRNQFGKTIPAFRTFAPDKRKFAVFEYNEAKCQFRFGCVTASGGVPAWYKNESRYMNTYELPECTKDGSKECPVGDCSAGCPACTGTETCIKDQCIAWSKWISDGTGASADNNNPLAAMKCQNGFCDKIAVRHTPEFEIEDDGSWTSWAEDGTERLAKCPLGHAAIQVECDGSCDKVRLKCARFPYIYDVHTKFTGWISGDHEGEVTCPDGGVITGVECKESSCFLGFGCGHKCDDKRLLCSPTSDSEVAGNLLAQAISAASGISCSFVLSSLWILVTAYISL